MTSRPGAASHAVHVELPACHADDPSLVGPYSVDVCSADHDHGARDSRFVMLTFFSSKHSHACHSHACVCNRSCCANTHSQQQIAAGVAGMHSACGNLSNNDSSLTLTVYVFVRVCASTGWPHLGACAMAH